MLHSLYDDGEGLAPCYSADLRADTHAGDNSATFAMRQVVMRCPPGRTLLQNSSTSPLHSRAIFTGSVKRFLAIASWPTSAIAMPNKGLNQFMSNSVLNDQPSVSCAGEEHVDLCQASEFIDALAPLKC
jgi:hypothetical protein